MDQNNSAAPGVVPTPGVPEPTDGLNQEVVTEPAAMPVEPVAPVAEPVAPVVEPVVPVAEVVTEPIAPVAEPAATPAGEPVVAPAVEPVVSVAEPVAPAVEPLATAPVAADQSLAQPVVPSVAPMAGDGLVKKGGVPKGAIIGIVVGIIVAIAAVMAIIFIPMINKPNYESIYQTMDEAQKRISDAFDYGGACSEISYSVDEYSTSIEDFNKNAEQCKGDIEEAKKAIDTLAGEKGFQKEFDAQWKKFEPIKNKVFESLNGYTDIIVDMHTFIVRMNELSNKMDDENGGATVDDVKNTMKPLMDSKNEDLKKLGADLEPKFSRMVEILSEMKSINEKVKNSNLSYNEQLELYEKVDALSDETYKINDEVSQIMSGLDEDKILGSDFEKNGEDFDEAWEELRDAVTDKYLEIDNVEK